MRLHRFYIKTPISGDTFDVTDRDLVHQWRSVFRYNVGSQVILFDGSGIDYLCILTSLRNLGATVSVVKKTQTPDGTARKNIWLCMALIKKDNFELAVQKASELGVSHIVPVICEHSEKRKLNMERMQKIAVEASEQSGRGDIMTVHPITKLADLLSIGVLPQEKVVFHPTGIPFKQYRDSTKEVSFAPFIGPEGGFSDKELELFKTYNMPVVSLGSQILRAETAAIAVSSLFLL
ncbi:MAG: Ribosomal small subunit methyltransferase [Patescibacteria group bacterium]|nr:Ribosomal small subunit methyltransferase [Patescibacteria group bacterium]